MTDLETQALSLIRDCQKILAEYLPPEGPNSDPKETISKLLVILDGPRSQEVLRPNADGFQSGLMEVFRYFWSRSDFGVHRGGGTLGFNTVSFYYCNGCDAEWTQPDRRDEREIKREFPHADGCKYIAAMKLLSQK